jgi:hypothetical protein
MPMFEAKSYSDVRQTISMGNGIFAICVIICAYLFVLSPAHKHFLEALFSNTKINPVLGPYLTIAIVGGIWGYLTTFMFSFHDRIYEPHIVNWRASYEVDFILRSLCFPYSQYVSPRLFEIAYTDKVARASFMQRLFYKFIGDSKASHEELRERFYTIIRNYWLIVLAELYCIAFLVTASFYCIFSPPPTPPYIALLAMALVSLLFRVWANHILPEVRPITIEQVRAIQTEHKDELEAALQGILTEHSLQS